MNQKNSLNDHTMLVWFTPTKIQDHTMTLHNHTMFVWFTPTKIQDHTMTLHNHTMFVWFTPSKIYSKMVLFIPTRFVFTPCKFCSHYQSGKDRRGGRKKGVV